MGHDWWMYEDSPRADRMAELIAHAPRRQRLARWWYWRWPDVALVVGLFLLTLLVWWVGGSPTWYEMTQ